MRCDRLDELAAAYAVGAVDPDEERAVSQHLLDCDQPHAEARELIGAAAALAVGVPPLEPSPALRERLMATIERTPQEHAAAPPARDPVRMANPRPWWRMPLPAALAAAGLVVAVGLGSVNVSLSQQLAERDAVLRAVAGADAIHPARGTAGSGWVVQSGPEAVFLVEELAELPADRIYELWLISEGGPVAVGVIEEAGPLTIVTLERPLTGATAFAVTVEAERVEAPTSDPVLVAPLDG